MDLDNYPSIAHMYDMLWLYAKDPIARLIWDPRGWFWSHSFGEQTIKVPFFQQLVKLGRSLLLSRNATILVAQKRWTNQGVSTLHLKTYQRWIQSFKGPSKFILFRWLLVHIRNVAPILGTVAFAMQLRRLPSMSYDLVPWPNKYVIKFFLYS